MKINFISKTITWFKLLFSIVKNHQKVLDRLTYIFNRLVETEKLMKERTEVHADVHVNSESHIIVVGRYRNNDFVKTYCIDDETFSDLVRHLNAMTRHAMVRKIDCHPTMKHLIKRDIHE